MKNQFDDFFFDDCPVCQVQKSSLLENRPLSEGELRRSMRAAEKLGATVYISPRATRRTK